MSICYVLTVGCISAALVLLSKILYEWQERWSEQRAVDEREKEEIWEWAHPYHPEEGRPMFRKNEGAGVTPDIMRGQP